MPVVLRLERAARRPGRARAGGRRPGRARRLPRPAAPSRAGSGTRRVADLGRRAASARSPGGPAGRTGRRCRSCPGVTVTVGDAQARALLPGPGRRGAEGRLPAADRRHGPAGRRARPAPAGRAGDLGERRAGDDGGQGGGAGRARVDAGRGGPRARRGAAVRRARRPTASGWAQLCRARGARRGRGGARRRVHRGRAGHDHVRSRRRAECARAMHHRSPARRCGAVVAGLVGAARQARAWRPPRFVDHRRAPVPGWLCRRPARRWPCDTDDVVGRRRRARRAARPPTRCAVVTCRPVPRAWPTRRWPARRAASCYDERSLDPPPRDGAARRGCSGHEAAGLAHHAVARCDVARAVQSAPARSPMSRTEAGGIARPGDRGWRRRRAERSHRAPGGRRRQRSPVRRDRRVGCPGSTRSPFAARQRLVRRAVIAAPPAGCCYMLGFEGRVVRARPTGTLDQRAVPVGGRRPAVVARRLRARADAGRRGRRRVLGFAPVARASSSRCTRSTRRGGRGGPSRCARSARGPTSAKSRSQLPTTRARLDRAARGRDPAARRPPVAAYPGCPASARGRRRRQHAFWWPSCASPTARRHRPFVYRYGTAAPCGRWARRHARGGWYQCADGEIAAGTAADGRRRRAALRPSRADADALGFARHASPRLARLDVRCRVR